MSESVRQQDQSERSRQAYQRRGMMDGEDRANYVPTQADLCHSLCGVRRFGRVVRRGGARQRALDLGVGQTFAKVFSKFAVRSRKAESRTKVAVSSWWVGTFIRPRSGRRDF